MRAMWIHYPEDTIAAGLGDQYLWGKEMIIAPVYEKGAVTREIYLPAGKWYDWWNNNEHTGGQRITRSVDLEVMPVFVKAGAIIPVDPVRQYTGEVVDENITLRIYSGADGHSIIYEDDGITLDYLDGEGFSIIELGWDDRERKLSIKPGAGSKISSTMETREFNVVLLPEGITGKIRYEGTSRDFRIVQGMIE